MSPKLKSLMIESSKYQEHLLGDFYKMLSNGASSEECQRLFKSMESECLYVISAIQKELDKERVSA